MYGGDGMGRWVKQTVFASTQTNNTDTSTQTTVHVL